MFTMADRTQEVRLRKQHILRGLLAVIATAAAALIASFLTRTDTAWYQSLTLSPLQPPPWAFGAVWTALYVLLAIAFARIASRRHPSRPAILGFCINLILNALWSPVFFIMQSPVPALLIMAAMVINLIILMRNTLHADRPSFLLLIPYLIWLAIAAILNISVIILN